MSTLDTTPICFRLPRLLTMLLRNNPTISNLSTTCGLAFGNTNRIYCRIYNNDKIGGLFVIIHRYTCQHYCSRGFGQNPHNILSLLPEDTPYITYTYGFLWIDTF